MSFDLKINDGKLNHAYCILGDGNVVLPELLKCLKKEIGLVVKDNPDYWYGNFDIISVDDGRKIREMHMQRGVSGGRRVSVVSANFITEQAQNAMLKIFEEPAENTHIFLISKSANNFLPTLRSRMIFVDFEGKEEVGDFNESFVNANVGQRIKMIADMLSDIKDEKESKMKAVALLEYVEKKTREVGVRENALFLECLEKFRKYAMEQSPSLKIILEYTAIMMPKI